MAIPVDLFPQGFLIQAREDVLEYEAAIVDELQYFAGQHLVSFKPTFGVDERNFDKWLRVEQMYLSWYYEVIGPSAINFSEKSLRALKQTKMNDFVDRVLWCSPYNLLESDDGS